MMPQFIEKWVEDTARHRIIREIGTLESEWPAHTASGVASGMVLGDSGSCSLLLSVPSSRWFKPRTLWIQNSAGIQNEMMIYVGGSAGSCSATLGGAFVPAWDTQFVALDCITVGGDLWVGNSVGHLRVRIAGILCNSGPEN